MLKTYRELDVWKRAMDLAEAVYRVSKEWDRGERFGMISQAQRASSSVAFNIAEGYGRLYRGEYVKHLSYARGSLFELETQLILATRVGVADPAPLRQVWTLAQRVGQMLNRHIESLMRMPAEDMLHPRARVASKPTLRSVAKKTTIPPRVPPRSRNPKPGTRNPISRPR